MNKSKLIKSVAAVTIYEATIAAITACASAAKPAVVAQNEPDISAIAREDDQYIGGDLEDINVDDLEDIDAGAIDDSDTDNLEDITRITFEDNTIFIGEHRFEDYFDGMVLAYVDVTGEPELISLINILFLIAALIIGALSTVVGFLLGKKMEQNELSQKQFFENTSHELKTPLTSIRGYAEGIQTGVVTDYKRAGNAIAAQTEKMSSMVEDILSISRIETGALKLQKENADMSGLVEDCLMPFEGVVASKQLDIVLDLQTVFKNADADRLEHVLGNLIGNAIKYASSRVSISCNDKELKIWNDCEPLSREDLTHMFDRFYTGKKGSTCIGLALAKEIVELHG
ncbi:MAG: HAMP domain-containing histidine kinase [Lachnospiraceae bacterium]|nr:HAMP domain-containing histidine kinase [Lachnospiraceae bacterium]